MKDPYEILGVSPSATDEEIKHAYRELAKKYHPDNYANNPLSDLASEKMKEINEAYDTILKMRAGGSAESSGSADPNLQRIRSLIRSGQIAEAEVLLKRISIRNAEWHYLMGECYMASNHYNKAAYEYQTAYRMEPNNPTYAAAYQRFENAGTRAGSFSSGSSGAGLCDICTGLMCADCLCECCGGDLITCC